MKIRARSATERATEINLMNFQLISRGSPATKAAATACDDAAAVAAAF